MDAVVAGASGRSAGPHIDGRGCACCAGPRGLFVTQSLQEVDFDRSPCGLAQRGLTERLASAVASGPRGARANERDAAGYAPLHYAARGAHVECVRVLLAAGADPAARTRAGGATPLHRAAWVGALECAELLVAAAVAAGSEAGEGSRALCLTVDDEGMTALHKACHAGHAHVARMLEEVCAEASEVTDSRGRRPRELEPRVDAPSPVGT